MFKKNVNLEKSETHFKISNLLQINTLSQILSFSVFQNFLGPLKAKINKIGKKYYQKNDEKNINPA